MLSDTIRIGTLVKGEGDSVSYIGQILTHGFESFALAFRRPPSEVVLRELAPRLREVVDAGDAVVSSVSFYGNPLAEGTEGEEAYRAWELLIDTAELFGCTVVGGFSGRVRGQPIDVSLEPFGKIFRPLACRAADRGVRIAFENCSMGGDWRCGDWNIAHGPRAWEMMFNEVDGDNLGLQWEPCHQMVKLVEPLPQLRQWLDRIFHIHGKDATILHDVIRTQGIGGPDPFAFHRTPGFGDCNWTDIISELRRGGFVGSIDIEGWHDPVYRDELEMTGQVHALEYLKRCRGGRRVVNPC